MRYGLFVVMAGRQAGGPETYERSLIGALAELDRENTYRIYCLSREAADAVRVDQGNFSFRILRPSIRWISIPLSLPLALARDGVELYHATFTPPPFSPKPYVFTHHCFSTFNHPEFYDPLILARLNRLLLTGLKKARRILCVSQNVLDLTAERLGISPNRMEVVYHGIEEQFHPMDKAAARQWAKQRCGISRPFVLFVGRLDARKNVARLIEAYHRFRQESLCDWPLVLAGRRGWQAGQIDAAVERLGARAYVIEAGYLRHEELPLLYNAAEMFVFPSLWEGFGLPLLEAMACGVPSIASNLGSLPEIAGGAAYLVDPQSVDAMAAALCELYSSESLRAQLREKGLARAGEFSWRTTAQRTLSAYQRAACG